MGPDLTIIVPAYNEARTIQGTLRAVRAHLDGAGCSYEVIVSADGTDGTRETARAEASADPRFLVIGTPQRGGKGKGIREGVGRAAGRVIGFVDADYKTPIEEMDKLLPWLEQGYDLVIGSRGMAESRVERPQPLYRRVGSRAFGLSMHLTLGLWHVHDTQCGFKFFRGAVAKDLFSRQRIDGYMFDVEILHLAARSGYKVKEVGVRWQDDGDSRLDLVAGNWRNFVDILRIRLATYPPPAPGVAASEERASA
jgi:glycosyltransferase involved in cell wall biosynthesis